jgi:transposase
MATQQVEVIGGVDTHQDLHHAAVIDKRGEILATRSFATTRAGYRAMLARLRGHGNVIRVGVEQTGSYGAGLTRHLALAGVPVLEVTGPDPTLRRNKGKDDTLDAIAAAKAALSGQRVSVAKDRSGQVEALRVLRTTRRTAIKCRRATLQQLHNTIVAAPEEVRDQLRNLTRMQLLRTAGAWRPDTIAFRDPVIATKIACKSLALRLLYLNDEIAELDRLIAPLVQELAPGLLELEGVGTECAGELLVVAGDNPDRLASEAGFAMLCGASPIPASSGKTVRHRLNRGGNRQANSALHMIVVCRMRTDQRTRAYVQRRLAEGKSKREIMRCPQALHRPRDLPRAHRAHVPPPELGIPCSLNRDQLDKHESVRGSQYTSFHYTQRLADAGAAASVGSVGDAYDNALAESFVDSFKTELLKDRVWRTRSELELGIVEYVHWFNNVRLHESLGDLPPVEFEALYAAHQLEEDHLPLK